jgi:hypothetical protein
MEIEPILALGGWVYGMKQPGGVRAGQECRMKPIADTSAPFAAPRKVLNVAGCRYVVIATVAETNGAYSEFEIFSAWRRDRFMRIRTRK